jgi:transcriptional regulator with XRE-family HTH domain
MREDIGIANNIMRLRKEQGLTQEDLANYLGVTKASVSKWETEQSFPDIALLPRIATYFGVSIDDLMGYAPQMTKAQIKRTYMRLRGELASQPFEAAHASCEAVVRDYWSCAPLLVQMAVLYLNHLQQAPEGDARDQLVDEAAGLCRRAKAIAQTASTVRQANAVEAMFELIDQKPDKAVALLDGAMDPMMGESTLLAQAYFMQGRVEEALSCSQVSIYQELIGLLNDLPQLAGMYADAPARLSEVYRRTSALIDAFDLEKVYVNCAAVYGAFAAAFMQAGDVEQVYGCLERYVRLCGQMEFPVKLGADSFFDKVGPWLEDLDLGDDAPRDGELVKQGMVAGLVDNPAFAALADEPRFKQLVVDLKARLS